MYANDAETVDITFGIERTEFRCWVFASMCSTRCVRFVCGCVCV